MRGRRPKVDGGRELATAEAVNRQAKGDVAVPVPMRRRPSGKREMEGMIPEVQVGIMVIS